MNYCQEQRLASRIDSSNLSLSFFRNRLRLQLLPLLRQYNPSVDQALLRLADIAKEDSAFIEQQASVLWDEIARQENNAIYLDKKQIANLPIALQRQLLRAAVARLAGDTRDIEANHIEAARSLLNKPVGKRISLPHALTCCGGYNELVIASTARAASRPACRALAGRKQSQLLSSPCPFPHLQGEFLLNLPGKTLFPGWRVIASIVRERADEAHCQPFATYRSNPFASCHADSEPCTPCHSNPERSEGEESRPAQGELHEGGQSRHTQDRFHKAISADFDFHKTGTELFVRKRQPGDRFQPLGMNMPKKLNEFMVDAKIPLPWREHIPIVHSSQHIVWVVGWRIDDRVKVTEDSEEILRLEFIKS